VLAVVQHSPLWQALGKTRMFYTLEDAVAAWQRMPGVSGTASTPGS
jgi:hypothetical protein